MRSIVAMRVLFVTCSTDPTCPWSWAAEPAVRALEARFTGRVAFTYVMGGLAREFRAPVETLAHVLDAGAASGQPVDGRLWLQRPPRSSHPACLAVKAATEQRLDGPMLRALRVALMCRRRSCDTSDGLVDVARDVAGMDVERFAVDLASNATVETFGADVEYVRSAAPEHHGDSGRLPFPSFQLRGDGGEEVGVFDEWQVAPLLDAARRAGAGEPDPPPALDEALARLGPLTAPEVAAVCDLPGPRAPAELWRAAAEWRARAEPVAGGGALWSAA
ncbi:MAG: DsbA family protein [Solirubrobacteraceae bacterium MAG38_C4-C5]|nr:DsbA family protein [Candidatus Siliceabacter maunaloa]